MSRWGLADVFSFSGAGCPAGPVREPWRPRARRIKLLSVQTCQQLRTSGLTLGKTTSKTPKAAMVQKSREHHEGLVPLNH